MSLLVPGRAADKSPTQKDRRRQIEEEYDAAYRGMNGFSSGTTRHAFINARMENIDKCRVELAKLVGEEEALRLMVQENDDREQGEQ